MDEKEIREILSMDRKDLQTIILAGEIVQGFVPVTWNEPWLKKEDWCEWTIITRDNERVRLVALDAKEKGKGAFTRLVSAILEAGLVPVVVEPIGRLEGWCLKHGWKPRIVGKGDYRQRIWYPSPH